MKNFDNISMVTKVTMSLDPESSDYMEIVFPGGPVMATADDVILTNLNRMMDALSQQVVWRTQLAMSGAMRWPWSQEAPLYTRPSQLVDYHR